jgi:hypothetical protein
MNKSSVIVTWSKERRPSTPISFCTNNPRRPEHLHCCQEEQQHEYSSGPTGSLRCSPSPLSSCSPISFGALRVPSRSYLMVLIVAHSSLPFHFASSSLLRPRLELTICLEGPRRYSSPSLCSSITSVSSRNAATMSSWSPSRGRQRTP